jgi:hypothetical protein
MPAKSKAQQRFMGMVRAAQKGELDNPSSEVEKAADSMSNADAKDYASTKHKGLPNHVKKENMEKELKEIIRQTYRDSLRESINEDATELPQATIPSAVKVKLQMAIDKIKDSKLSNNAKLQLVAQVIDALDVDKSQLSNIANKIRSKMESVNEVKYPTNLYVGSVIYGQGFTGLKGIEGGKYYKVVEMDDTTATLAPCDQKGKITGSKKVRHKLDSIEGGIKTAKRGDENGIVIESVNESISHEAMGIASMTNTRKEAVQKFIDDNNLDAKEILTHVTKGKLPERIRFVQALVGTPNNSSFKWYVKNYANESVTEASLSWAWIDRYANAISNLTQIDTKDVKKFIEDNKLNIEKIFAIAHKTSQGKTDFIKAIKAAPNSSIQNAYVKTYANESVVTEGKKAFRINPQIGKAKYSISAHNGVSKHKDGSDFWDILIFKNKADLEKGIKDYKSKGFVEESINESIVNEAFQKGVTYGGTKCNGGCFMGKPGLEKIIKISKESPEKTFMFRDDNYSGLQPHFIKDGVIAKATVLNPAYDFEKHKVNNLKIDKDVILSVRWFV